MNRTSNILLFAFCLLITLSLGSNTVKIERIIELTTQFVDESVYYEITNEDSTPLTSFEIAVEKNDLAFLSVSKLAEKRTQNNDQERLVSISNAVVRSEVHNDILYDIIKVTFKQPLEKGRDIILKSQAYYSHRMVPKPAEIPQGEHQKMLFQGNLYVPTVSESAVQVIEFRCMHVLDYKDNENARLNNEQQLIYGPYDVSAWEFEETFVHLVNTAPFITIDHLVREIEVSHWGNVAVEDSFQLHHAGSELEGSFSRVDYMMGRAGNSIPEFVQHLPEGANEVYYRDIIGNISTSHVYPHPGYVRFEHQPRFVMFGGWQTKFKSGYNLPTDPYLSLEDSQYVLRLPFVNAFENAVFDEIEMRVILPEGAENVEISAPVPLFDQVEYSRPTYLDTDGRVVISFFAKNIISEHRFQKLEVRYTFEPSLMVREPLLLIAGFFVLFVVAIVYFRSNFALQEGEVLTKSELQLQEFLKAYLENLEKRNQLYTSLSGKNLAKKISQFNMDMNAAVARSQTISSRISELDSELGSQIRTIEQTSKDKSTAFRMLQTQSQAKQTAQNKQRVEELRDQFASLSEDLDNQIQHLSSF